MSTRHNSMYQCFQRLVNSTNVHAATSQANVQSFKCNSTSSQQGHALQFSDSWSRSGCSATNVESTVGSNNLQIAHLTLSRALFCFPPPLQERMPVSSPAQMTMYKAHAPPYDLVPQGLRSTQDHPHSRSSFGFTCLVSRLEFTIGLYIYISRNRTAIPLS